MNNMAVLNDFSDRSLLRNLSGAELEQVSGGGRYRIETVNAANTILTLGAFGGPATFGFAVPIALSLYFLSGAVSGAGPFGRR